METAQRSNDLAKATLLVRGDAGLWTYVVDSGAHSHKQMFLQDAN